MTKGSRDLLLKVQTGGRLTIPHKDAERLRIEDGDMVLVKIGKAVITAEEEEEGEQSPLLI